VPAERVLPTAEHADLVRGIRSLSEESLRPHADAGEASGRFPAEAFRRVGAAGVLGMAYPAEVGGRGLPHEVYLQVVEEIAAAWATIGIGVSAHSLSCFALVHAGTVEQRDRWLPGMLGGDQIGAYCLSEAHAGSDPAAMRTRAVRDGDDYVITGEKAWILHAGQADFCTVLARTSDDGGRGISCFVVPGDAEGLVAEAPEEMMGLSGTGTAHLRLEGVRVPAVNRIGDEGQGLAIALAGLARGRLGMAAAATGIAQAALDVAVDYARERETFGQPIVNHQGVGFLLADMAARVESARATYLAAARRLDAGLTYSRESSVAKLVATDNAMAVTSDAVQVLGGIGYTRRYPAERYMREVKVMQIFEGTNQIQRLVIARELAKGASSTITHTEKGSS
jgi:alkylation response protein AidB-like acyl-CoA dehydrogenase